MLVVQLKDVHVYLTLAQNWRAYVKREHPAHCFETNAWGYSKQDAINKLAIILAESNIPFNFAEDCQE